MTTTLDATTRRWLYAATALLLLPLLLQLQPLVAIAVGGVALLSMALSTRGRLPALVRIALALTLAIAVFSVYRRIGRDTGCALLAMMLALKPTETANVRDARSLVAYGLFAPFATYLLDQGPLSLLLGALAVAAALATLLRLSDLDAGIDLAGWSPFDSLRAAGKLLLLALPLVLAAFWLFPRLASPLWGLPDRAVSKPGLSESMTPDRWMDALNDDSPAMRARFEGTAPRPQEMYWRAMTLDDFDGSTWRPTPSPLAAPKLSLAPTRWRYTLDVEPSDQRLLATLEFTTTTPDGAQSGRDASLRSIAPLTGLTRWQLQAAPVQRFDPALDASERRANLALPNRNPRTLALGRQWRREAGSDDVAIISRALDMIRKDFAYSLTVPEPGRDWIDDFLFQGRTGYCQQFSSAFVVLMRGAGIPARVVIGYAGGYHNPVGDYWVIRNSDAHAWAEVWLARRGWTRIDPTAAVAPERIYDTLADRMPGRAFGGLIDVRSVWNIGDDLRRGWNDFVLGFNANRQATMFSRFGIDHLSPSMLIVLFAIAAGIALAITTWWLARGERERDPLLRAWRGVNRRYATLGLAREAHETADDWLRRVQTARPQQASDLSSLVARFNTTRYAMDDGERRSLIRALRSHRP
ncbi:transglutaminase TgpA family protein [Solilutibacter silvestris]|uniref:transglutaminase TgpA family protein n=1 Tax=Solilutibacter silvestris TaxID=1645665 RepID=UPI003CCDA228